MTYSQINPTKVGGFSTSREGEIKMETLKDIKEVLSKIPDEDLERFQFGVGEGSEDRVSLICMSDGDDGEKDYHVIWDKYPELSKLNKLIENVKKAQAILDEQENLADKLSEDLQQEGITDTYFDKKEVKPNSSQD